MELATGTKLGPYEIVDRLGAGGMGEVYRALDTRLGRTVAIKVLAPRVATDQATRKRFQREARAISALNHPHICSLYDVGTENGHEYLVMEYLEGESLAERLAREPLPYDEALAAALQIANALERAHRQGIVHRDLKPGNVMLTRSGAKLLDFGLARIVSSESSAAAPLTADDAMIGTVDYMAPEQLSGGGDVDARADIFSFGVLLYELFTGARPFSGHNRASIIGAILFGNPTRALERRPELPTQLDLLIAACLEKNPDDRVQTAHDVRLQLQWIKDGREEGLRLRRGSHKRNPRMLIAALSALAVAASGLFVGFALRGRYENRVASSPTVSSLELPPNHTLPPESAPAISPDGRNVAIVVAAGDDTAVLLRSIDNLTPRIVPNTRSAIWVTWSRDSRHLLIGTLRKIGRVDTVTGGVTMLADAADPRGATENHEGDLIYAPTYAGKPLMRIPADGRNPEPVTRLLPGETSHRWPQFLPDGRHFLYFASRKDDEKEFGQVCIGSIDSRAAVCSLAASSQAAFVAPNFLLCSTDGVVKAYEFDTRTLVVKRPVGDMKDVDVYDDNGFMLASGSANGRLTYMARSTRSFNTLQWVDRSGKLLGMLGQPSSYESVSLSRNGQSLAVTDNGDIWIHDLKRKMPMRITFDRAIERDPVWAPDDRQIAYNNSRPGHYETRIRPSTPVADSGVRIHEDASPMDWSTDGRFLAMEAGSAGTTKIVIYSMTDRRVSAVLSDRSGYGGLQFSPDGASIAYTSNISGTAELYVDSFPKTGARTQVSSGGALWPRWRGDGKELFFVSLQGSLMAVRVETAGGRLQFGTPRPLFAFAASINVAQRFQYDVSPDGNRFVIIRPAEARARPITLVSDWTATLGR